MVKILIIEDESLLREEIAEWLTFEGYEASTAPDGVVGVRKALLERPDLIICDIMMPGLDGYGVLIEVHAHPETVDMQFIFVTARSAHEDIRMGMALGADDYITKPFSRKEILQAIEARIRKKEQQRQAYQEMVTQIQQALTKEKENRLFKSKLIAMFAHDFSNPLTAILVSNSMIRDYADRMDEQRRLTHTARIEACVHQLIQMLDDLLIVSKMESGHFELKLEMLNIGAFFEQMIIEYRAIYGETHKIIFEDHFQHHLLSDVRLLQQIGSNLISNAIKYSPGMKDIQVTLAEIAGNCVLTVQDNGIGIPQEDQARLFEAFQRGSNVGSIVGTGLGLAIVKQAVDLHNATLQFESKVGIGTTMAVHIPM